MKVLLRVARLLLAIVLALAGLFVASNVVYLLQAPPNGMRGVSFGNDVELGIYFDRRPGYLRKTK